MTKLSHYRDIRRAKLNLLNIFDKGISIHATKVDNICATKLLYNKIDLDLLFSKLKLISTHDQYSLKYYNQKFPGLFICFNRSYIRGTIACLKLVE